MLVCPDAERGSHRIPTSRSIEPSVSRPAPTHSRPSLAQHRRPSWSRWSLSLGARRFGVGFGGGFFAAQPPTVDQRPPSSRLWNPINYTPREPNLPNKLIQHPQLAGDGSEEPERHAPPGTDIKDSIPLLTLPEKRRSRQSATSLAVEVPSGRTSIGLPRDRESDSQRDRRSRSKSPFVPEELHEHLEELEQKYPRSGAIHFNNEFDMSGALDTGPSVGASGSIAPQTGTESGNENPPAQVNHYPFPIGGSTNTNNTDRDLEHGLPSPRNKLHPYGRAPIPPSIATSRSQSSLRAPSVRNHHGAGRGPGSDHGDGHIIRPDTSYGDSASHVGSAAGAGGDEYAWGPSHPCFPHMNAHVPLTSPLYSSTRIIRIKRDWMIEGDLAPTYSNLYPEILDPLIPEGEFRMIIRKLNDDLIDAFNPFSFWNTLDGIISLLTFWLWEDFGFARIKRRLAALERWIEAWNRDVGAKEGVRIISLRRTGYLTLDIQIPDPHIGLAASETAPSRPTTRHSSAPGVSNPSARQQYAAAPSQYSYTNGRTASISESAA
ncbi:hypothetical protein L228DRAFT_271410 [Xylona heveae TC161]|uniref:Ras modification protein ERF4 n=1 Tax=Xylona heveae (strain CBS 132557 / TC161) TaxID=1328760 RepID=A0A164ZIV1_XYLHT|nr:hypothetical protein L228DRAFT_271410 [Xylona heveae TC161]KZF19151.1 hypothetical protein L228DRAFT_271410 [Xylona heveae TC161]